MIFFDFETTNHSKGSALDTRNRIVMVSWCVDGGEIKNHTGPIHEAREFWRDLDEADVACAFNCKFEIHWLKRFGYDVDRLKWHDPMLGEKVLLGNIVKPMSMDKIAGRYGHSTKDPMIDAMMKGGVCPSEMPQKRLRARCNRDVRVLRALYRDTTTLLRKRGQLHLYRNRCDFAVFLAHVEANGMHLDSGRVEKTYAKYAKALAEVKKKLDEITGGINMNSPDQKAHFLYGTLGFPERQGRNGKPLRNKPSKQFPKGRPKTDADTITWLMSKASTPEQILFVSLQREYSKLNAALSKNLEFFVGVCREYGGTFHAQFNQTIAATHRLTSSGLPLEFKMFDGKSKSVQFQNMPRDFKGLFCSPDPDYYMVECDAMQLEFRVAAFAGNDAQARRDIADPDFDAHCRTASVMKEMDYMVFLDGYRAGSKTHKVWRTEAKPDTFKPLYGGTKGTPEQERYYKAFAERYDQLHKCQLTWLADVIRQGYHRTAWGMVFTFETHMNRHGVCINNKTFKPVGPQIFNYPVQNLATAEIVPIAIVSLYNRCKERGLDVKFVNTVHDSVICYVHKDHMEIFLKLASKAFTQDVYEHLDLMYDLVFDVPLGMEAVYGQHWGEGEEFIYDDVKEAA